MCTIVLIVATAACLAAAVGANADERPLIKTDYWLVSCSGAAVTIESADPDGRGRFTENLGLTVGPLADLSKAPKVKVRGRRLVVTGIRALAVSHQMRYDKLKTPVSLEGHKTIGVLVHSRRPGLCYAALMTPTWTRKDSAVTMQVRRGGPSGPMVARRRFENLTDNAFTGFYFDPLPAGDYLIELVDPSGPVGCWAQPGNPLDFAEVYIDGKPDRSMDFCMELKWGQAAPGRVEVVADGASLSYRYVRVDGAPMPQLTLSHRWVMKGYEVSPRTTPVRAYVTDDGQYLPAHQLKRRARPELALHPGRWLRLLGTGEVDVQLGPIHGACDISLSQRRLAIMLPAAELTFTATRDGERWLEIFPRIHMPDPEFTRDWNTFLLERAFSYHPLHWSPMADWMEWRARMLYWMRLPGLMRRDMLYLLSYKMTPDGYVYTWGDRPEWPFPDNEKYDARHFTTNANYILACWRAYCWTGDRDFLRRVMPRVRKAMNFQLTECRGAEGLFIMTSPDHDGTARGVPSNYWDDIPFGYKSAYENIYFYASLFAMAELEREYGRLFGAPTSAGDRALVRPPEYYLDLARRVHENYDKTFWAGDHYIACVDVTGERHDFGITYVNLEAFAYGLGDREKARKFYHWLETVVTDSGKADMYYFQFAPRVNAWDIAKTWWYLEGKGEIKPTKWGTHCENGGAILYTSHFDIIDRARYIAPADALERMRGIIERWRQPDHLSGGNPLWHQEVTGWMIGTDIPFPESGLAPIAPVYAFLGLDARVDGLHIRPNLNDSIAWIKVTRVCWRGISMDISAGREGDGYRVRVRAWDPPQNAGERVWHIPRGGEVVLREPLQGQFPNAPLANLPWEAHWIWVPGLARTPDSRCYARKVFAVARRPDKATLALAVDNDARIFLDGRQIGAVEGWHRPGVWDVTGLLKPGRHVLAIEAVNGDGPAGVVAQLTMRFGGGKQVVGTDETWRVSPKPADGWTRVDFDDSAWQNAEDLGVVGVSPWGWIELSEPQRPR